MKITCLRFLLAVVLTSLTTRAQTPELGIEATSGQQARLSWPEAATGYVLERATRLSQNPDWQEVNAVPVLERGRYIVVVAIEASEQYFRLRRVGGAMLTTIVLTSPVHGEAGVSVNRETILDFSAPLAATTTITADALHAQFGGRRLLARVELSSDRRRGTLFYLEPIPAGARIRVTFNGDAVLDSLGQAVDANADGKPGGTALIEFDTMNATGIPGTAVTGHVFASDPVASSKAFTNRPLAGVLVTVDGAEERLRAATDANGFFKLEPCPTGKFFVHIDGRPAVGSDWPNGAYYPFVGKTFEAVAGRTNNLAGGTGEIFLPLIKAGTLQPVSPTQSTTVTFPAGVLAEHPELAGVSITVPANALFDDNGTRGGRVGIAPVASDRIPSPLPAGLGFPLVFTIQTDGPQNFDQPAAVRLPNLPDPLTGQKLPPGAKSALWSYNHDTGRWEIQGSMTVTADGQFVETDPGVGVRQPGWHGVNPGNEGEGGGGEEEDGPCGNEQQAVEDALFGCALGAALELLELAPGLGCAISISSAVISNVQACNDPAQNCAAALVLNSLFGAAGCIPGLGLAAGIIQCALQLGSALGDLAACEAINSSTAPAGLGPSDQAIIRSVKLAAAPGFPNDPLEQQFLLNNDARNLLVQVLGDERWVQAAGSDGINTRAFGDALVAALSATSESGARISAGERTTLLNLPAPAGLALEVRTALLDRFDRFAAGGITPAETTAIQSAGNALAATSTELENRGWTTMIDGQRMKLQQISAATEQSLGDRPVVARALFYRLVDLETGFVRRGRLNNSGRLDTLPLAADRDYQISYLDPTTLELGSAFFQAGGPGGRTSVPRARLVKVTGNDSDSDGLSNLAEDLIGTNSTTADSDNDGVNDLNEVTQGLDPLSGLNLPVGIIANVPLPGEAQAVIHDAGYAYVATATHGLAVVDIRRIDAPLLVGQLDLSGYNSELALARAQRIVGIAAKPEGIIGFDYALHFVDVSNPSQPRLLRSLNVPAEDIVEHDGLFFVALKKEVRIYDPSTGLELGWTPTGNNIVGITAAEGRLYVAGVGGLEIYQIALPTPVLLGRLDDPTLSLIPSGLDEGDLIVANGVLHAGAGDGYVTLDVSDPAKPVALGRSTQPRPPIIHALSLNGSGLLVSLISFSASNRDLAVFDASDPTKVDTFLFSLDTLGISRDLDLVSGVALVADGRSGLTIINPLGTDGSGKAPQVTADLSYLDIDPARAGIQLFAGSTVLARAQITDDVQLREARLVVNGQIVATTDAAPVVLPFDVPAPITAMAQMNMQFQAVDTGGNVGSSAIIPVEIVPETRPPQLAASLPRDGSGAFNEGGLVFRFDEPLTSGPRDPASVTLLYLGADGQVGGGDDISVSLAGVEATGATLVLTPAATLTPGAHQLTIPAALIADRAGNRLAADLVTRFTVFDAALDAAVWTSPNDGRFDDPANWLYQRAPGEEHVVLPAGLGQPVVSFATQNISLLSLESHVPVRLEASGELEIRQGWIGKSSVVISNGTAYVDSFATFDAPVLLTGGLLQSYNGALTFKNTLTIDRGADLILEGAGATLALEGGLSAVNFTLIAQDGAVVSLPQFTDYQGVGDFTLFGPAGTLFRASGPGSRITLPELTSANGPVGWNVRSIPRIQFEASDSGLVELPKLTTLTGRTGLKATGTGSKVNAPMLASITGPESDFISAIDLSGTSEVVLSANATLVRCDVTLQSEGTLRGGSLELAESSSLEGVGTVVANIVNRGSIVLDSVPGNLVIEGRLELAASSVISTSLGLGTSRTEAGRLELRGDGLINGSLQVVLPRGFTPQAGQQFEIALFAKPPTGALSQVNDSALGAALKAELETLPAKWTLKISPRP